MIGEYICTQFLSFWLNVKIEKDDLYDSLLARKYNLRNEFTVYFNNILDSYSYSKEVDVSEWKKILNNQGQMK